MARDAADLLGVAIGRVARETAKSVSTNVRKRSDGTLAGPKGVAAGVGLVTLAPLAAKGATKLVRGLGSDGAAPVKKAGEKVGGTVKGAGGATGGGAAAMVKRAGKAMLPGGKAGAGGKSSARGKSGDSKGGKSQGVPGVGKGRRMPIQQDIDIGVPLKTVYNQWTQFEDWPNFMHRLQSVSQEDDTHVKFKTKIWGISKEFQAEIVEQRPDERIKWRVTDGVTHQGVVTFHELGPRLTRVEVNLDVEPGSLIEKAARGMRHVKRAVRADMARFKAYVLMEEAETGAWRSAVEDGDVKRPASRGRSASRKSASSSRGRSRSAASGRRSTSSSSGGRSRSSSAKSSSAKSSSAKSSSAKSSSRGGQKRATSKSRQSSNGRSSSSRTRGSSSNGRSRSTSSKTRGSSNGRSSGSRARGSTSGSRS